MQCVKLFVLCLMLSIMFSSCANKVKKAIDSAQYSAWETVGVEKRDLFKRKISNVKDDQEDTGEAFKDALTQLKEVYAFDGGNLEKEYNKLNNSYEEAQEESAEVSQSITKLNEVAQDLFVEWEGELQEIKTADLKRKSAKQLSETRSKYKTLHQHLKTSENKMAPVLARLKDQVLFLKHNLNAKAIGGLKAEGDKIESDIEVLLDEMNRSTKEAEEFIETL